MKEENALNKSINVNIDPKIVVAIILFVVIGVVFYMYGVTPKIAEMNTLNTQIAQAEQKLNVLLLAQDRLSSIENEINLYNNRLTVLKNVLPPTPDEFLFSEEFVVLANKNGGKITNLSFSTGASRGTDQKATVKSFDLSFESAQYANVQKFIQTLKDNYPQIITISQVDISRVAQGTTKTTTPTYSVQIKGDINLSQRK